MNVSNNLNNLNKLSFGELKTFAQLNSAGNGNVNNANSKYNNAVNNTNATNTASSNTPKLQEQVKEDTVVLFGKEVKKKNLAIGASIIGGISIVATLISVLGRGKAIAGEDAKLVEKLKEGFKAKFTLSGRKNYNEIINNNNKNNKVTNNNNGSVNNANNNVNDNSVNNSKTNEGNVNNNGNDTKLQSPETPTENKLENKLEKEQENNPLSQTPAESDTPKTPTGSQTQEGLSTNKEGVKDTAASETPKTSETPGVGNNDATSQQLEAKEIDLGNKTQYSDANRAAQELKQTEKATQKYTGVQAHAAPKGNLSVEKRYEENFEEIKTIFKDNAPTPEIAKIFENEEFQKYYKGYLLLNAPKESARLAENIRNLGRNPNYIELEVIEKLVNSKDKDAHKYLFYYLTNANDTYSSIQKLYTMADMEVPERFKGKGIITRINDERLEELEKKFEVAQKAVENTQGLDIAGQSTKAQSKNPTAAADAISEGELRALEAVQRQRANKVLEEATTEIGTISERLETSIGQSNVDINDTAIANDAIQRAADLIKKLDNNSATAANAAKQASAPTKSNTSGAKNIAVPKQADKTGGSSAKKAGKQIKARRKTGLVQQKQTYGKHTFNIKRTLAGLFKKPTDKNNK